MYVLLWHDLCKSDLSYLYNTYLYLVKKKILIIVLLKIVFMKKLMMALAFVGLGTVAANAQCDEFATPATSKYSVATNSFWSNWYIQVGVDATVQNPYGANFLNDMWHDGRTYGLDLAIGKWFTPGIGVRLKGNWENGAFPHAFRNQDHLKGRSNKGALFVPDCEKGGAISLYFDTQFNLSNLFCGYNENRVWNLIMFPRMGIVHRYDGQRPYSPIVGAGIHSTWKISKLMSVYLEGAYNFTVPSYCSYVTGHKDNGSSNGIVTADLGLTFNLGKGGWSKAVSLEDYEALSAEACAKLAALRAQLKAEQDENARLRDLLAKQPKPGPAAEKVVTANAASVFFDLNSAKINSKKDLINIEAVATAVKNTGAKVLVTGSADSKTGSSAYNQKLSEARAQAVADELVNLGVDRSKIEVKGIGGVNDITPYTLNRRAVLELK